MNRIFLRLMVLLLCWHPIAASSQGINSLNILPSAPNSSDSIRVVANAWLPSGGCWIQNYSVQIASHHIYIYAAYETGMMTVICNSIDTFNIGRLDDGQYYCHYYLYHPSTSTIPHDSLLVPFTVTGASGIKAIEDPVNLLQLQQQSPGSPLRIKYELPMAEVAADIGIFDQQGRLLQHFQPEGLQKGEVGWNPSGMASQTLVITLTTIDRRQYTRKFTLLK